MFNKKLNLLICMILLLIIPIVSSVPPVQTTIVAIQGLEIETPNFDYLEQGVTHTFRFRVYNASDDFFFNKTHVNCSLGILNDVGDYVFQQSDVAITGYNFAVVVNGGNFSELGVYHQGINCYHLTSKAGGVVTRSFEVTPNGAEVSIGRAIIDIGLLLTLVIFLVGCVVLFMENNNLLARVGFLGFGYLLLIAITFITWNMASDFITSNIFIAEMFRILFFVLVIGAFPLLIGAFAWYLIMLFKIKEITRLMEHGFSEDEAQRRVKHGK